MRSTRRFTLAAGIAALAICAAPALASADVYCVDTLPTGCDHIGYTGSAGLQQALSDAQAHSGTDAVHIGVGTYNTTGAAGFNYSSTDPVSIVGAGQGSTVIAVAAPGGVPGSFTNFYGFNVLGPSSSIASLTVTLPAPADAASTNQQYTGILAEASNASVNSVAVQGPGVATNATGVQMTSGQLVSSTIALPLGLSPGNVGFRDLATGAADVFLTQDTITADTAVADDNQGSGTVKVGRSTLRPAVIGVSAQASHVQVANSVIDLGSHANTRGMSAGYSNPVAHTSTLSADGVTIYGAGPGQVGIQAVGNDANTLPTPGDPDVVTGTVANTIIRLTGSFPTALRRDADNNAIVNLATDYSDYDQTTVDDSGNPNGASGALTQQHQTSADPGFVNPGIDFHLASSSALIDAGDPANPPFGAEDIDGDPRVVLGKPGCAARRDIGADEFVPLSPVTPDDCAPPDTSFLSGPTGTITDNTPTFTFDSSEQPSTFQCSVDGGTMQACTSPFTSVPLGDGPHTLAVQAIDASSNADPTPATRAFTVDTTAPDTAIGSHPKPKTKSRKATFTFTSTEAGSTFLCSYDGLPYAACSGASFRTPKLKRGKHRFDVIATDSVGNRDQSAASFFWKIKKRKHHRR
jgi:hypothetical protein